MVNPTSPRGVVKLTRFRTGVICRQSRGLTGGQTLAWLSD